MATWLAASIVLLSAGTLNLAAATTVDDRDRNILILNSGDSTLPASLAIIAGLEKDLTGDGTWRLNFFTESLDAYRFPSDDVKRRFAEALLAKYDSTRIDLIFALGPETLELLIDRREQLFPHAPVVFCAVQRPDLDRLKIPAGVVGTVSRFDSAGSVRLALALQPNLRRIVVITGAASFDRHWAAEARAQLMSFEPRLEIDHWSGLPMQRVLRDVARLRKGTAVLFLSMFTDGEGERFVTQEAGKRISQASSVPTYGVYSTLLGQGPVGGYFDRFEDMGAAAGALGRKLLAGAAPASLPPADDGSHAFHVDWRQLERWSLSEANLPPGAVVHFKTPTLWEQHRSLILGTFGVVLLQTLLIALLLVQRQRTRNAETSLRESEERMALAAAAANLGLWHYEVPTGKIWTTDHLREMLGLPSEGELSLEAVLGRLHPEDRPLAREALKRAVAGSKPSQGHYRTLLPDGSVRWLQARAQLERKSGTREPHRLNGIFMDVTRSKEMEEEADTRRDQLAHLTRVAVLGELSGALAHELNQPLAAILSNAQAAQRLLERSPGNIEEIEEILKDIVADDRRAGEVIRKLRGLLKQGKSEFGDVNLNDLVEEALNLVRSELVKRRIRIDTVLAPDLMPVYGDRVQLQQVLLNLVVNACDAMVLTPVARRVITIESANAADAHVRVSVTDQGEGFVEEFRDQLFEPFVSTKPTGLGIGLAVSRSIIAAHGGAIGAESRPAGGTSFHFTIPVSREVEHGQQPAA